MSIDWFSFILGFVTATLLVWVLSLIFRWLKSIFQPAGDKPLRQRWAAALRNLMIGALVLAAVALLAYMTYSVLVKPVP